MIDYGANYCLPCNGFLRGFMKDKNRSRTEFSVINIFTGVVGYIINTIMGFVCRVVFVRCLSDDYLGLTSSIQNFLGLLSLTELGVGTAIIYELYKPIAENNHQKISSLMRLYAKAYRIIGTVIFIFGIAFLPLFKIIVGDMGDVKESLYVIYGLFLINTAGSYFFSYRTSLVCAYQYNYVVLGLSYLISIVQSIVQIIILLTVDEYLPYLLVLTVGTFAYNIIITVYAKKKFPFIDDKHAGNLSKEEKRGLFKNIKALTIRQLSGVLVNHTDNLVITYFTDLGITGLASNYSLLSTTLSSLIYKLFSALTPSVGNLNASEDIEHQFSFFKTMNLANFWAFGWGAIGIAFVSSDLVQLLYGADYVMPFSIPLIIAVNFYMDGMGNAIRVAINTKGLFKYDQYVLLTTAVLNIVLDIVMGKLWGVFGIYLATAISRLLTNVWYEPYIIYKKAYFKNPMDYLIKYLYFAAVLIVSGGICYFLCSLLHFDLLVNVIIKILICSVVPNAVFVLAFFKMSEFEYVKNICKNSVKFIKRSILRKNS